MPTSKRLSGGSVSSRPSPLQAGRQRSGLIPRADHLSGNDEFHAEADDGRVRKIWGAETRSASVKPRESRGNFFGLDIADRDRTGWLGREDSNLRMAESKSAALPLGYAPSGGFLPRHRARTLTAAICPIHGPPP